MHVESKELYVRGMYVVSVESKELYVRGMYVESIKSYQCEGHVCRTR
jgi:hypothetical protein